MRDERWIEWVGVIMAVLICAAAARFIANGQADERRDAWRMGR